MKKPILLVLTCISLFIIGIVFLQPSKAQNKQGNPSVIGPQDHEMASTIRRLTDHSTDGLVDKTLSDGSHLLDLKERFQSVPLAMFDQDGDAAVRCVTSIEEANDFFGRNLETGEYLHKPQAPQKTPKDDISQLAGRSQMSVDEYQFYLRLIEEATKRSQGSRPDSATITITNADGAGEGFNDASFRAAEGGNNGATLGAQRLNLFNFAAGIWGAFLDSSVPINVNAQFNSLMPCDASGGVLGSAGAAFINRDFPNATFAGTWYSGALANKMNGVDQNGAGSEINATFNSDVDTHCLGGSSRFYYGLDNATPANTVNLLVVLLHEMGHGLGFQTYANAQTGVLNSGFPDIYNRFSFDRTTGLHWYQMTNAQRAASALNTNNLLWDGPSVRIASGGLSAGRDATNGNVQLFAPNPFQGGSSVSHYDTLCAPNLLMEPIINVGLPINLDLTRQQMRDIGWYRDTNTDLTPDTITSVFPSGNTVIAGSNVNITWTNGGGFAKNVVIELSTDGGTTFPTTIASDVANTGTRSWTVPNTPTTTARIRVREFNFAAPLGMSAANFTIATSGTPSNTPTNTPTATATATATPTATATGTPATTVLLDTFTAANTLTFSPNTPRTYMGDGFKNTALPGGTSSFQIKTLTIYMGSATAQTYTDVVARLQFWNVHNGAATPVFSGATGGVVTIDLGPITTMANVFYTINVTLGVPITLTGGNGTNWGFAQNFQGNTGSGLADTSNLTSLVTANSAGTYAAGLITTGTSPTFGFYRASSLTNFNFNPADANSLGAFNAQGVAIILRGDPIIATPTSTATATFTPTATATFTPTATATFTPTPTRTATFTPTATATATFTPTATSTATFTPTATSTATFTPTATATATFTPTPTRTATFTPTATSTATATATFTPTATSTATFTPTATSTATFTPTATSTATFTPTATSTATFTPTATSTATFTPTSTATATFTPTATATSTFTPTATATATFTPTATSTATFTPTSTSTATFTPTATSTATFTPTATATFTPTATPTEPALTITPNFQDFGLVMPGNNSSPVVFTVHNNSSTTVATGVSYTIAGPDASSFSITSNSCGPTLNFATTCTLSVTFSPTTLGPKFALLNVSSANLGTTSATLVGTGSNTVPTNTPTDTPTSTATATATPTAAAVISGTVTYGNAIPAATRFVSNVLISAAGSPSFSTVTGTGTGQYSLTGFGSGAYTVTPSKSAAVNGSITSFDAARIAQHAAGSGAPLTGNALVVADVSGTNGVSSFDAGLVARYVAGVLPPPANLTGNWIFLPANRNYASVTSSLAGEDYSALLMGEVSGNWTDNGTRPANSGGPERSIAVSATRFVTPADGDVIVPVRVSGAANKGIISYEFDLRYDASVIQPQANPIELAGTVSSKLSAVANTEEPGLLRVVVYGAMPIKANGILLNLRFTAIGAAGSVSPLTFDRVMFNEGDPRTVATDGQVELSKAATNAAEINGRLLTAMGQGIPHSRVTLTDTEGKIRSVLSNGFGVYRFGNLQAGQTYTISVESDRYTFAPLTVSVLDQGADVDVIAEP